MKIFKGEKGMVKGKYEQIVFIRPIWRNKHNRIYTNVVAHTKKLKIIEYGKYDRIFYNWTSC